MGRGCVNFVLPVAKWTGSWTKAFWYNIQVEKQGSLRQAFMYGQYSFSKQKQGEAKVQVKETDSTWGQFFPVTELPEESHWTHWGFNLFVIY